SLQSLFQLCHKPLVFLLWPRRGPLRGRRTWRRWSAAPYAASHKSQELKMDKSVILITGALTGIGRAAAVAFAKKGAKVVVSGRRDEAGQELVKELRSFGSEAEFINADVRKEGEVRAMVDKTVTRFGRLDVAVNNAATEGQVGPITDQTAESFAATFETNVLGVVLSMKCAPCRPRAAAASSISPRPMGTGARPMPRSMSGPSTPSKALPSRWRSNSPSRGFEG